MSMTNNNHEVRVTQHSLGDYNSALAYEKCSRDIILRLFGKKTSNDHLQLPFSRRNTTFTCRLQTQHEDITLLRCKAGVNLEFNRLYATFTFFKADL